MVAFRFIGTMIVLLALADFADGQTTFATLTGTVKDPNGAVIPGATIEATHVQTNYRYVGVSNEIGVYTLAQLRDGEYVVRSRASGFKEFVAKSIQLDARDIRRLDIELEIGAVETTIEVSGGATLIETETPRITDTKGAGILNRLPLNTRSALGFLNTTAGVYERTGATGSATIRYGGSRTNQENAAVDGITFLAMDGTAIHPIAEYLESVEELKVDMANNTAEFGSVGQVTVISKSGGNRIRGSVFDYYTSTALSARNPFATERSSAVRHSPGGSLGGPISVPGLYDGKDRSFFFVTYETNRGGVVGQLLDPTVPLPSWHAGDFSRLAPGVTIRDPFAGSAPFPDNRIPASRLNPVSLKIQDRFYPVPNFGNPEVFSTQNYREVKLRDFDPNTMWTARLDHRFSTKAFVFGRYSWNRSQSRTFNGELPTIGQQWFQRDTRHLGFSYSHTLRSNLLNEFRYGFAFNDTPRNGPLMGKQIVQELGLIGLVDNLPDINGVPNVSFSGLGLTGITQLQWRHPGFRNRIHQYQDHVSWFRGRHSVKFGLSLTRTYFAETIASNNLFGGLTFSNRFTGHPYADFLLGIPTTAARAFPPLGQERLRWQYEFFVTDDFKLTPRLSLSLGARYDYNPGFIEPSGRAAIFDIDSGKIVVPNGSLSQVSPLLPRGYVDVVEARDAGVPDRYLVRPDRNNIAPRIGLAYRPWGNNTVFRAGYGIFYDVTPVRVSAGGSPFEINEPNFTNPVGNPVVILPRVFPDTVGGPTTVGLPTAVDPGLLIPYSMQYSFTVEHQRWNHGFRLSYIGTNTRKGEYA
jgi:Carboxypeptidase regulatory-like domain/TonB dependent receptor-like, beta-barrel